MQVSDDPPRPRQGLHQAGEGPGRYRAAADDLWRRDRLRYRGSAGDDQSGRAYGWHNHPAPTLVAIAQGEGTLYHAGGTDCTGHNFAGSDGFFQPSAEVHNLRNEASAPLVLYAFYVLPTGTPNTVIRTDQPQPANCPNIP